MTQGVKVVLYYHIISRLFNEKTFPKERIQGKRILIVGGNDGFEQTKDGERVSGESFLRQHLQALGAAECLTCGMFYGLRYKGMDFLGDVNNLAGCAASGLYDIVILLEGMEKIASFHQAEASLRGILQDGGLLYLLARTPADVGTSQSVVWCEDYWRYDVPDIPALFPAYETELGMLMDKNRWLFVRLHKKDGSLAPGDLALFSPRANARVTESESRQLGYFHQQQALPALGNRWGTDKNFYGHNYLDKYEFLLRPLRDQAFTLLELGVFNGGSERMWQEYFPLASIVGVDIEERCRQYEGPRIHIEIMDLGKEENLQALRAYAPRLIIDDASHLWSHQILALFQLFSVLPSGGIYILEDMETSLAADLYPGYDGGSDIDAYTVCERIARVAASRRPDTGEKYAAEITAIGMAVEMVATIKGACVFIKR